MRLRGQGVSVVTIRGEELAKKGYGGIWGVGKAAESPPGTHLPYCRLYHSHGLVLPSRPAICTTRSAWYCARFDLSRYHSHGLVVLSSTVVCIPRTGLVVLSYEPEGATEETETVLSAILLRAPDTVPGTDAAYGATMTGTDSRVRCYPPIRPPLLTCRTWYYWPTRRVVLTAHMMLPGVSGREGYLSLIHI
eukprot:1950950-Rhodomonas_salina.1